MALFGRQRSYKKSYWSKQQLKNPVTIVMGKPVRLSQTIQAKKPFFMPKDMPTISVPYKKPSWFENILNPIKTGLDIWKDIETIKHSKISSPTQIVREPYVVSMPEREPFVYQPQSQLPSIDINTGLPLVYGALETIATAPKLIERTEQITAKTQKTGLFIASAIGLLAIVLLARRK